MCAAAGLDLSRTEAVGSGRACQRPRTSSGAKCFSCEGALAREIAFLKFFTIIVAPGGARLADEERGAAKRRGRGRGRRNIEIYFILLANLRPKSYAGFSM